MLACLLRCYGFDTIFCPTLERVQVCFFQLERLLDAHLPTLAAHMHTEEVMPGMYASGWFMTMFSSSDTLPIETVCHIWTLFFLDGWKAMFRVVLALLSHVQDQLLEMDMPNMIEYLHTLPADEVPSVPELFATARKFKVTNRQLRVLEQMYRDQRHGVV